MPVRTADLGGPAASDCETIRGQGRMSCVEIGVRRFEEGVVITLGSGVCRLLPWIQEMTPMLMM